MRQTSSNEFRANLKSEVDACVDNHQALKVTRKNGEDFVVISASDWESIVETNHLNSIPGMAKSILKASKEGVKRGIKEKDLDW